VLGSTNAAATIAVKDIAVAQKFYEDKLGLELSGTEGETVRAYRSGSSTILVYQSRFAGLARGRRAGGHCAGPHYEGSGVRTL
jgi:catechol 2,3-dioxygenase-like lactoylglutathione lyase family enzyme